MGLRSLAGLTRRGAAGLACPSLQGMQVDAIIDYLVCSRDTVQAVIDDAPFRRTAGSAELQSRAARGDRIVAAHIICALIEERLSPEGRRYWRQGSSPQVIENTALG